MKYMEIAEFEVKCLQVMDEVATSGEEIVVTNRGEAVARVLPPLQTQPAPQHPSWAAGAHFYTPTDEDLISSLSDLDEWDYDESNLFPRQDQADPGASASD
ncbi:MAG: hypothetical protein M3154_02745 [Candidatus Eremiobacteraeota bacterium]|nr:hypothetical protein [Candidatus Eremiobacteraeota bacterium]